MFVFIKDFFIYPFVSARESNRFYQFLQFLGKDYPAYFWAKPSFWRVIVLPFLAIRVMIKGNEK